MSGFLARPARIVAIDDEIYNCALLKELLESELYQVDSFTSTMSAWDFIQEQPPDLLLLDVYMPAMTGFELCQKIKADSHLKHIPIIFLSARSEEKDIVKGFEVGGVDYIAKPFSGAELLARVRTHLLLQAQRQHLKEMSEAKDKFLHITSHDLRNPLSSILMTSKLLRRNQHESPEMQERLLAIIERATQSALSIVQDLVARQNLHHLPQDWRPVSLPHSLRQIQKMYGNVARSKSIDIQLDIAPEAEDATIMSSPHSFLQILDNLLSNAVKFSPRHSTVTLSLFSFPEQKIYQLGVRDQGPGFDLSNPAQVFDQTHQAQPTANELALGVGLTVVKELCEKLEIEIELHNTEEGALFTLSCPHI